MNDKPPDRAALLRTRIFIVLFFGAALLLSVTTILGTWSQISQLPPAAATPAASK
jgi:hypothetical protein